MKTPSEGHREGRTEGKAARARDLRYRIAYTKPELSLLLPYGHTTLEEMIKKGMFPDGMRPHPTAHKIWPRAVVEAWLERTSTPDGSPGAPPAAYVAARSAGRGGA